MRRAGGGRIIYLFVLFLFPAVMFDCFV